MTSKRGGRSKRAATATSAAPAARVEGHSRLRFAAFIATLNELDILPAAIAHLRSIGVEIIYVFDYGSVDGTLEYLEQAEDEGDIWVFRWHVGPEGEVDERVELARHSEVDWVLLLDTDEIWLPASGSLHDLVGLDDVDVLQVARYNVVLGQDGPMLPLHQPDIPLDEVLLHAMPRSDMGRYLREHPDAAWIEGHQMPSVMVRPAAVSRIDAGDHGVRPTADSVARRAHARDLLVAHVPFRTFERFERKAASARKAVELSPEWYGPTQGWQWLRWAELDRSGGLAAEFARQITSSDELEKQRATHEIRSAAEILSVLIPGFASKEDFVRAAQRAQPWISAAASILRDHEIPAGSNLRLSSAGLNPTVLMHPDHVVKLFDASSSGHATWQTEVEALRLLDADLELPVPRLIAHGTFDGAWGYIIESKIAGTPLVDVRDGLTEGALDEIATWVGRFIQRLHAVDPGAERRAGGASAFRSFIEGRYARLRADLTAGGALPDHLLEQVEAWLPPLPSLLGPDDDVVPLHSDLHDEHILGHAPDGRFHCVGVVDFDRFRLGHRMYEIGQVWDWLFRGESRALRTFLRAAGYDGIDEPGFPRRALAWCLLHQGVAQVPVGIPSVERISTLDELADATFAEGGTLPVTDGG